MDTTPQECPWCQSTQAHSHLQLQDDFLSHENFEIIECGHCHLLYTSPRPAPELMGKYYKSDDYYSHKQNRHGLVPRAYEFVKSFNVKNKVKLAIGGLPSGHLLDIGCGVGDFLLGAKRQGWEICGIEPSEDAAAIASDRLGFTPMPPSRSTELADASFDVITLWHVLEHVDNLRWQVDELQRLLRPRGRLVIALPNYRSFDGQYYGEKWAAWDVPRHLNHFSEPVIRSIITSAGFNYIDTHKLVYDAYYISFLSEKYQGHSLPLLRGALTGLRSNLKAARSGEYSSLAYRFAKL